MITHASAAPCWVVDDGCTGIHYLTFDEATDYVDDILKGEDPDDVPAYEITEAALPCFVVHCAHCGTGYCNEDNLVHFDMSLADTARWVGDDWLVDGDVAVCPDCACAELGHDMPIGYRPCLCGGRVHKLPPRRAFCLFVFAWCKRCGHRDEREARP